MAKWEVAGQIVEADSPEQAYEKYTAGQQQPTVTPVGEASLLSPLMQGLTWGHADELGGLGARLGAWAAGAGPERRDIVAGRETERQRGNLAATREEMFWPSMLLEGGGALMSGGPAFKGLHALGSGVGLGKIAAPIFAGSIEGGIAGAGSADENKVLGADVGATLGGGLSAAMPVVAAIARTTGNKVGPYIKKAFEGPLTTASRVLSETMEAGGVTPTLMRAGQRQLGPEASFVDVTGAPGLTLGQGVIQADKSGQALQNARREMAKRAARSTGRLESDIRGITGIEKTLDQSLDAVRARQKQQAAGNYALANQQTISLTPKLKNLLSRPPMEKAFNEAKDAAATRGDELPDFFKLDEYGDWKKSGVLPDMQAWDRMKQSIDRMIEGQTDAITGRVSPKGRDLTMLKNELVNEIDEINPAYKRARNIFAGDAAIENAMRDGERFLNMKTREVSKAMGNATDSEKEAFLTGAVEAIREKMGRARSGEIGEFRFLEQGNTRKKLRSIFPEGREGDKQVAELMRTLNRERTFASTQGSLVGGSQTALRQAAGDALKSGASMPTTTEALINPLGAGLNAAMQAASKSLGKTSSRALNEMGGMLFDPNSLNRTILEMERRGIKPVDMMGLMQQYSRGGARMAPLLGLGAGEMTNQ